VSIVSGVSIVFAQPPVFGREKFHAWRKCKDAFEVFMRRADELVEKGVITEQEKQELKKLAEELKEYREEIWKDDKITKEEQRSLIEKEKAFRGKVRDILEKAREKLFEEYKTPEERERIFNEKIDNMLKRQIILQKEADEIKKQHKELLEFEEKIWSDGVMTKEEQRELLDKRRRFHEKLRKFFKKHK
jgi:predicted HicB family RNase H-like nuclease